MPPWIDLKMARFVLTGELLLLPVIAMFAPLGLATMAWAGGALLLCDAQVRQRLAAMGLPPLFRPLAILAGLGSVSALWSLEPLHSLSVCARLFLLLLVLLLHLAAAQSLEDKHRQRLMALVALGGLVHLVLAALAGGANSPLGWLMHEIAPKNMDDDKVRFNRGIACLAVMGGPYLLAWLRWKGVKAAGIFLAVLLVALAQALSMAAPMADVLGLVAGLLTFRIGRLGVWTVYGSFMLLLLILPALLWIVYGTAWMQDLLVQYMSWNIKHRLIIWQFSLERYLEHPLLGWGLDASRYLPGGNQTIPNVDGAEFMPLHPHNGYVQVWLELGVAGALCLALWLGALARHQIARLPQDTYWTVTAAATAVAYLTQGLFSYGIWQNWWIAVALFAAAFLSLSALRTTEP